MSEKKVNPLLNDDPGESPEPATNEMEKDQPAKAEAKSSATKKEASLKAEAIAKFPKDIVAQTKYILDNSEHVNFIVPKIEGEIGIEQVQINGYKIEIERNVMVSIPIQVAKLLAEKYRIALEAGREYRIDSRPDKAEPLG